MAAYVKLTEEASSSSSISVDEVLEYAKTGLARFKVPKYLKFTGISNKKKTKNLKILSGSKLEFLIEQAVNQAVLLAT